MIQGTLVAGADSQFFRLDWASSPDSVWDGTPHPIPAGLVALTLSGAGATQPLVLRPGGFGVFVATLPVLPESTYTLSGTVDGTPISATTTIPGPFAGTTPAGDTLTITTATDCVVRCVVPFDLVSPGSAESSFEAFDALSIRRWSDQVDGSSGALILIEDPAITYLVVTAFDPNFVAYVSTEGSHSSIEGAFGMLGSAIRTTKSVVWQ